MPSNDEMLFTQHGYNSSFKRSISSSASFNRVLEEENGGTMLKKITETSFDSKGYVPFVMPVQEEEGIQVQELS